MFRAVVGATCDQNHRAGLRAREIAGMEDGCHPDPHGSGAVQRMPTFGFVPMENPLAR
jgi:hypothetical protein